LPLSFEANQGQSDAQVKYLARGRGYTLFLASTEAVLALARPAGVAGGPADGIQAAQVRGPAQFRAQAGLAITSSQFPGGVTPAEPAVLRMKLVGANTGARLEGVEELPGKSHYFIGNDPKKWRTNVPHYARVRYRNIYPGVDLVYYGNQRQLEHDFVVAPGADPHAIRLRFEGAEGFSVDAQGDLLLATADGGVRLQKPVVYQERAGVHQAVAASYALQGKEQVGFELGAYDPSRALVIDPVFVYSTYLGGSGGDEGFGIAVDAESNAYVTGSTTSADFPTVNPLQPELGGPLSSDAFVAKLAPDGSSLVYSTYLGGSRLDIGVGIAVDAEGSAYLTGQTFSLDFPTANALQPICHCGLFTSDAFVTKLSPDGSALVYSTFLGGSGLDGGSGIAVAADGSAYVTGGTFSRDFPTGNALQPDFGGTSDAFIAKFAPDGSALLYSTYLGGSLDESGTGIAVDADGNAYVTGWTGSVDFPTANPLQPSYGGGPFDAFVAKLTSDGSALVYSTYLGGSDDDLSAGIAIDAEGNAYVAGHTSSRDFPTANALQPVYGGGSSDGFVAKLAPDGSALVYSTYLGGSGRDVGGPVAVDSEGNAYVTGQTNSANFPTANALQPDYGGGLFDAFVAKLTADGSALAYSTYLGGSDFDRGLDIAVDEEGNAYVTGETFSRNFPTAEPFQPDLQGLNNAFVVKIGSEDRPERSQSRNNRR
jgi:hypothetical protein